MCGPSGDFENCADAYFPDCRVTTDRSCAQVHVGMPGVTIIQVTGEMGTQVGGAWPVLAGLPASGSPMPLVIDFAANSILHINSGTYIFPPNTMFRMHEGASIVVDASKFLQISTGSHLFSCDKLWKGIRLENGSRFQMYQSVLEDAAFGVDIIGNVSALILTGNTFRNNFTGLRAAPPSSKHDITVHHLLESNHFQSTVVLKPPYSGAPTYSATAFGFAGMDLADMKKLLVVSGTASNYTTFQGLCYGVRAKETSLFFSNAQWSDINVTYVYPGEFPTGVHSTASVGAKSLTVQGLGYNTSSFNTFYNCLLGTYADGIDLRLRDTKQEEMVIGVFQRNGSNRLTEISRNTIDCTTWGINCQNNVIPTFFDLNYNNITFQNTTPFSNTAGILAEIFAGAANCYVRYNTITTNGARYGLYFNDVQGLQLIQKDYHYLQVLGNEVTMLQQSSQAHGIGLYSAALGLVGNQVTGDDLDGTAQDPAYDANGFLARISPCLWCCNEATKVYNGIRIAGDCKFTDQLFGGNVFHEGLTHGLRLGTSGILGQQYHRNNMWLDPANTWQAWNEGGLFNALSSPFYVSYGYPTEPAQVDPPAGWFFGEEEHEPDCEELCPPDKKSGKLSELDERVAANEFHLPNHETATRWSLERRLYRRLSEDAELAEPGSVFESFLNAQANELVGQLTALEQGIETVYALSPEEQDQWLAALTQQAQLREDIALRDSLLSLADEAQVQALLDEKAALLQEYEAIGDLLTEWWSAQVAQRNEQLAQLTEQNNSIQTEGHLLANNEQIVHRIVLSHVLVQDSNLSDQDHEQLESIAAQCALDGGAAVYQARAILDWVQNQLRLWPENCGNEAREMGVDRNKVVQTKSVKGYQVFPNPVVSELTIKCPTTSDAVHTVILYNILGQVVMQVQLANVTSQLSLQPLPTGVYWLSIREAGRIVYQQKVVKN